MPWPKISELQKSERPREKIISQGASSLSDAELIGLVFGTGTRDMGVVELSRQLLKASNFSLPQLAQKSQQELQQVKGIGPAKATMLLAVFELSRRLKAQPAAEKVVLSSPEAVGRCLISLLGSVNQEEVYVFLLDSKNVLVHSQMISRGLLDQASLHPREVYSLAISHRCARLILAHNHPSGDPTPSSQDYAVTKQLVEAGKVLGVELLDHVVVGSSLAQLHNDSFCIASAMPVLS